MAWREVVPTTNDLSWLHDNVIELCSSKSLQKICTLNSLLCTTLPAHTTTAFTAKVWALSSGHFCSSPDFSKPAKPLSVIRTVLSGPSLWTVCMPVVLPAQAMGCITMLCALSSMHSSNAAELSKSAWPPSTVRTVLSSSSSSCPAHNLWSSMPATAWWWPLRYDWSCCSRVLCWARLCSWKLHGRTWKKGLITISLLAQSSRAGFKNLQNSMGLTHLSICH